MNEWGPGEQLKAGAVLSANTHPFPAASVSFRFDRSCPYSELLLLLLLPVRASGFLYMNVCFFLVSESRHFLSFEWLDAWVPCSLSYKLPQHLGSGWLPSLLFVYSVIFHFLQLVLFPCFCTFPWFASFFPTSALRENEGSPVECFEFTSDVVVMGILCKW